MVFCLGDYDQGPPPPFWSKKNVSYGESVSVPGNIWDYAFDPGGGEADPTPEKAGSPFPTSSFKLWALFYLEGN